MGARPARRRIWGAAAGVLLAVAGCTLVPAPSTTLGPVGPGPVETLEAVGLAWRPVRLDLPAGVPATIVVDNRDPGIPHGLEVRRLDDGAVVFLGEIAIGPVSTRYLLPGLVSAAYTFRCPVHPTMTGEIFVR